MAVELNLGYDLAPAILADTADELRSRHPEMVGRSNEDLLRSVSRSEVLGAIAYRQGIPYMPGIATAVADKSLVEQFDSSAVKRGQMVPLALTAERLTVAVANPFNPAALDYCQQSYPSHEMVLVLTGLADIEAVIGSQGGTVAQRDIDRMEDYGSGGEADLRVFDLSEPSGDVVPDLLRDICNEAVSNRASDIHFFTEERRIFLKFRINGDLTPARDLDPKLIRPIDAVLLHLVNKQPEDGRKEIGIDGRLVLIHRSGRRINCRFVRHRSLHGYHAVLRILDKSHMEPKLGVGSLAFDAPTLFAMRQCMSMADGIIIMSGPTGSGKSTTLDAMVREVKDSRYNIMTLENPVEQEIPEVVHCDMHSNEEFKQYIRAHMRADPDILLMGEVRDNESAALAVEAAITGHQVFTTIHTPSAAEILDRLAQLRIPKPDLARTLRLLCAQRLVKSLCPHCRIQSTLTSEMISLYRLPKEDEGAPIYEGNRQGCQNCVAGYTGRKAVIEVLPVDRETSELIATGSKTALGLEAHIRSHRPELLSLQAHARNMLLSGDTDLQSLADVINLAY